MPTTDRPVTPLETEVGKVLESMRGPRTREAVALASGISSVQIARIERAKRHVTIGQLEDLVRALVSLGEIETTTVSGVIRRAERRLSMRAGVVVSDDVEQVSRAQVRATADETQARRAPLN